MLSVQGGAISWKTRRQPNVLSSTEAEYMALSAATQEALYLKKLVSEFDQNLSEHCITIHVDNQGAIASFHKTIRAWNGLAFAEAPSLAVFRSNLFTISVHPFRIIP